MYAAVDIDGTGTVSSDKFAVMRTQEADRGRAAKAQKVTPPAAGALAARPLRAQRAAGPRHAAYPARSRRTPPPPPSIRCPPRCHIAPLNLAAMANPAANAAAAAASLGAGVLACARRRPPARARLRLAAQHQLSDGLAGILPNLPDGNGWLPTRQLYDLFRA